MNVKHIYFEEIEFYFLRKNFADTMSGWRQFTCYEYLACVTRMALYGARYKHKQKNCRASVDIIKMMMLLMTCMTFQNQNDKILLSFYKTITNDAHFLPFCFQGFLVLWNVPTCTSLLQRVQ